MQKAGAEVSLQRHQRLPASDLERYADPENLLVQGINMTGGRPESRLAQNSYHM